MKCGKDPTRPLTALPHPLTFLTPRFFFLFFFRWSLKFLLLFIAIWQWFRSWLSFQKDKVHTEVYLRASKIFEIFFGPPFHKVTIHFPCPPLYYAKYWLLPLWHFSRAFQFLCVIIFFFTNLVPFLIMLLLLPWP